jgi:hypothetical protein
VLYAAPLDGKKCHSIASLEALSCHFSHETTRVDDNGEVHSWWAILLLFSLPSRKNYKLVLFVIDISTSVIL